MNQSLKLSAFKEEQINLGEKYQDCTQLNIQQVIVDQISKEIELIQSREKQIKDLQNNVYQQVSQLLHDTIQFIKCEEPAKVEQEKKFEYRLTDPYKPVDGK